MDTQEVTYNKNQIIWIIRDELDITGRRLSPIQGTLVEATTTGWRIQPKRTGNKFKPAQIEVPSTNIMNENEFRLWQKKNEKERAKNYKTDEKKAYRVRRFRRFMYGWDESIPDMAASQVNNYELHPLAMLLPEMNEMQYNNLIKSINAHGQLEPCWTFEGKIVDGRHRLMACNHLGIACTTREWNGEGGTLAAFVVGLNVDRRHLTQDQRAVVALAMLPFLEQEAKDRQRQHAGTAPGKSKSLTVNLPVSDVSEKKRNLTSVEIAAKTTGANAKAVQRVKKIAAESPELLEEIRTGKMTLSQINKHTRTKSPTPKINWKIEGPRLRDILERIINADDLARVAIIEEAKVIIVTLP
jgi:hypothetical protein